MANANNNFMRLGEARATVTLNEGLPATHIAINTWLIGGTFFIERWVGSKRTVKSFETQEAFEAFLAVIARQYPWTKGKLL
jgi:hypothetical protein